MRWFVGDVQGCARELEALLTKVRFDPARDQLWCLGDLVNRGPESLETLRLWRDVGGKGVIGNHEIYALLAFAGTWPRKQDTLQALFDAADPERSHDGGEEGRALWKALRELPALVRSRGTAGTPDVWLVHAGLDPRWTNLDEVAARLAAGPHDDGWFTSDDVSFATRVRCCTADGERSRHDGKPEDCPPPHEPWDHFYEGNTLVVHGHWAWRGAHRTKNVIGLDSGCVYGGPLTAYTPEEDRFESVPSKYPRR